MERVSLPDAAEEIGCAQQFVRNQMKNGEWDLGCVVKPGIGSKNYQYFIFRKKLDRFLGKEVEKEELKCVGE